MYPTLREKDVIILQQDRPSHPRVGDVILFTHPIDHHKIIHRIVRIKNSVETQGDWNHSVDPWQIDPGNIISRIDYVLRGNRKIRIHGGALGGMIRLFIRCRYWLQLKRFPFAHSITHRISGALWRFLPTKYRPRIYTFAGASGEDQQLLMGRLVIGWRRPGGRWFIKHRYRMFVRDCDALRSESSELKNGGELTSSDNDVEECLIESRRETKNQSGAAS